MLGHDCTWRRCVCLDHGDPMRNRVMARKLRRARKFHERDTWRRALTRE